MLDRKQSDKRKLPAIESNLSVSFNICVTIKLIFRNSDVREIKVMRTQDSRFTDIAPKVYHTVCDPSKVRAVCIIPLLSRKSPGRELIKAPFQQLGKLSNVIRSPFQRKQSSVQTRQNYTFVLIVHSKAKLNPFCCKMFTRFCLSHLPTSFAAYVLILLLVNRRFL